MQVCLDMTPYLVDPGPDPRRRADRSRRQRQSPRCPRASQIVAHERVVVGRARSGSKWLASATVISFFVPLPPEAPAYRFHVAK